MQGADRGELQTVLLAPAAELRGGLDIGRSRIFIADRGGEEFEEMLLVLSPAAATMAGTGRAEAGRAGRISDVLIPYPFIALISNPSTAGTYVNPAANEQ